MRQHRWGIATLFGLISLMVLVPVVVLADASNQTQSVSKSYAYVVREISPAASKHITEQAITSQYSDFSLALAENHIIVFKQDRTAQTFDTTSIIKGVVTIERAPVIHLTDGKKTQDIRSWSPTVSGALTDNAVPQLASLDKVTPDGTALVTDEMEVRIVRVSEADVIEKQIIPFTTVQKDDPNLLRGQTKVVQEGKNGTKEITHHLRREDGVTVSDKVTKTAVTVPKQDKTVTIGQKVLIGQRLVGRSTWYDNHYAAASHVFSRGTRVRVTNPANGKSLETVIDDYMESDQSVIDLQKGLFAKLANLYGDMPKLVVEEELN